MTSWAIAEPQRSAHQLVEFLTPSARMSAPRARPRRPPSWRPSSSTPTSAPWSSATRSWPRPASGPAGLVRRARRRGRTPRPRPLLRGTRRLGRRSPGAPRRRASQRAVQRRRAQPLMGMARGSGWRCAALPPWAPSSCCASASACSRSCSTSSARSRTASRCPTCSRRSPSGASGLLGGCPVALVLDDPLDPERPIVAVDHGRRRRSETELAIVATAAARTASTPSADGALAASVHINGARAGALVAMASAGFDDAQLGMLDAFAEHASLALTDARTVEAHGGGLPRLAHRAAQPRALPRPPRSTRSTWRPGARPSSCVLFVDLDRFKAVNDSARPRGRRRAAARGRPRGSADCTRAADTAARFGGDEFAVLLEDDGRGVRRRRRRRRASSPRCAGPSTCEGKRGLHRRHGRHRPRRATPRGPRRAAAQRRPRDVPRQEGAAASARRDLSRRRCTPRCWRASSSRPTCATRSSATSWRSSTSRWSSSRAGRTVGVEALARWTHPTRGLIPPLTFIPVAEEIGVIGAIGRWVLREACRQLAAWRVLAPGLVLNVNLSAAQLRDDRFAERRRAGAARPPACRARRSRSRSPRACCCRGDRGRPPRACGASRPSALSIAVDDFGTGYSSLSYLQAVPGRRR